MQAKDVLNFWFGGNSEKISAQQQKKWFMVDHQFDALIKRSFTMTLLAGSRGKLDEWELTPEGRLAFIILLDQFPRNIFRGTANAFLYDEKALSLARDGVEFKHDTSLSIFQRVFFYMPYQHSESLKIQQQSVQLFATLVEQADNEADKNFAKNSYQFALQHQMLIQRFGRFPHRNKVLGRQSTQEETEYLQSGGARFGQ